jgi:hypothetical protein
LPFIGIEDVSPLLVTHVLDRQQCARLRVLDHGAIHIELRLREQQDRKRADGLRIDREECSSAATLTQNVECPIHPRFNGPIASG